MSRNRRWWEWLVNLVVPMEEHRRLKREIKQTVADTHTVTSSVLDRLAAIRLSIRSHRPLQEIDGFEAEWRKQEKKRP